uniref:Uncharacterized protein n=1 Tax=Chromera velia CCMP2878 TaxID=1169474 RepID=A0A0G4I183_9ALVE|eukprot:Cvel_10090.t1-p1 / transcript=Cvel_10090.t1 / gene=Cvel_10090 / organism=Chromera_velia_CCMP2878 / gene_product=Progesterone-induced-blocking factor 1, putative / transcript_product=Progesterone-induced-blocking factor 1, putative / location=Cvel_scaffold601:7300-18208(+) / protein_length=1056 / sequence_SO=supercontig / SO=protein_coding / is_pseudo=false
MHQENTSEISGLKSEASDDELGIGVRGGSPSSSEREGGRRDRTAAAGAADFVSESSSAVSGAGGGAAAVTAALGLSATSDASGSVSGLLQDSEDGEGRSDAGGGGAAWHDDGGEGVDFRLGTAGVGGDLGVGGLGLLGLGLEGDGGVSVGLGRERDRMRERAYAEAQSQAAAMSAAQAQAMVASLQKQLAASRQEVAALSKEVGRLTVSPFEAERERQRRTDERTKAYGEEQVLREQLRELEQGSLSEAEYHRLKAIPEAETSLREFVLLRFHEASYRSRRNAAESSKREENAREQNVLLHSRLERTQNLLHHTETALEETQSEQKRHAEEHEGVVRRLTVELDDKRKKIDTMYDKALQFDRVNRELEETREGLRESRTANAQQAQVLAQTTEERRDLSERLETASRQLELTEKDRDCAERRVRDLQDEVFRQSRSLDELQRKVTSAKEKKAALVEKLERHQVDRAEQIMEKMDAEVRRAHERAQADVAAVRREMTDSHQKETESLRAQVLVAERRETECRSKIELLEKTVEDMRVSSLERESTVRVDLTDCQAQLRVNEFERERLSSFLTEKAAAVQEKDGKLALAEKKIELLKTELFEVDKRGREEGARMRTELAALVERVKGQAAAEQQLDFLVSALSAEGLDALQLVAKRRAEAIVREGRRTGTGASEEERERARGEARLQSHALHQLTERLSLARELQMSASLLEETKARLETEEKARDAAERELASCRNCLESFTEAVRRQEGGPAETGALQRVVDTLEKRERELVEMGAALEEGGLALLRTERALRESQRAKRELEKRLEDITRKLPLWAHARMREAGGAPLPLFQLEDRDQTGGGEGRGGERGGATAEEDPRSVPQPSALVIAPPSASATIAGGTGRSRGRSMTAGERWSGKENIGGSRYGLTDAQTLHMSFLQERAADTHHGVLGEEDEEAEGRSERQRKSKRSKKKSKKRLETEREKEYQRGGGGDEHKSSLGPMRSLLADLLGRLESDQRGEGGAVGGRERAQVGGLPFFSGSASAIHPHQSAPPPVDSKEPSSHEGFTPSFDAP